MYSNLIITSADYASVVQHSSDVSFGGWGASARAEMAMSKSVEYSSKDVIYLLSRNINYGFEGWERPPPLSEYAKDVLCSN
jgi:hypothetical protein